MSNYNAESIQQLTFREGVRKRVGMYLGAPDNAGVLNGLFEVINNATDESLAGFGQEIYIGISQKDKTFVVTDKGRGIPRGKTGKSDEILITLMTTSHSGGKFDKNAYAGFSRGLNGVGAGATAMSSDFMEITTKRDGHTWFLRFEDGVPTTDAALPINETDETGSSFYWKPSQEVFEAEEININIELIKDTIEEYSYFNPGVSFVVEDLDAKQKTTYLSKNGIKDFATKTIKNPIHKNQLSSSVNENGVEIDVIAQWTTGKENFYLFVNGAECPDGGTPITGAKTAITRTINNIIKEKYDGDLIRRGLVYIISIKHPNPMFSNQTKTSIGNPELRGMCDTAFTQMIKTFQLKHTAEFEKLMEVFLRTERAEAAAERARLKVMEASKEIEKNQKRKVFSSDKLKDSEVLGEDSMLLLVEGNSASSTITRTRDYRKYGVLELRGKLINVLSNPVEKIYENEEIKLLLSAMNINPKKYNAKKLRYGKLGICVDGDAEQSA